MTSHPKTMKLAEVIFEDLALRDSAVRLFESIESASEQSIVVDFSGVRSMSRSFADEYLIRRSRTTKTISETNIPTNVQRMFDAVSNGARKKRFDVDAVNTTVV